MLDWKIRQALKEQSENAKKEYWQLVDPNDNNEIKSTNPFIRELQELCNVSDAYNSASIHLDNYIERNSCYSEETKAQHKQNIQDLEDEELQAEVEFYTAFNSFVKKYSGLNEIQRKGGSATSEKKALASRKNGKLGGRPRKTDK